MINTSSYNLKENRNKIVTSTFICIIVIVYVFFFTSKWTIPKAISDVENTTKFNQAYDFSGQRTYTVLNAVYDETQEVMEISLVLRNNSYDAVNEYYYALTLLRGTTENIEIEEVLNDPLMTVVRIHNLKKSYKEMTFMLAPKSSTIEDVTDEDTAFITLNKRNVVYDSISLDKSKVDYMIDRLQVVISEYKKTIKRYDGELDSIKAEIISLKTQNQQLVNNQKYMTDEEIMNAEKTISANKEMISSKEKIKSELEENIEKIREQKLQAEEKLSELQNQAAQSKGDQL